MSPPRHNRRGTVVAQHGGRASVAKVLLGLVGAAVALVAGVALIVEDERGGGGRDVGSIVRHADELLGEEVTVTGSVGEITGAKSFTMTEGAHRLLVLDVSVIPAIDNDLDGLVVDERVTVTGVLLRLGSKDVKRYLGVSVEHRYSAFLGEPVVLADSFRPR